MPTPPPSPDQLRHQRRTALMGAAILTPFALLDLAQDGPGAEIAAALVARLAWVLSLLAGAAILTWRPARASLASALMAATTAAAVVAIVAVTGGTQSGYFAFLLALPFCMLILLPGHLVATTASGAAGMLAGAWMLADSGAATVDTLRWIGTGLGASALSACASHASGALFRRELEAARARAAAAAALALSERRRATAERLALVGQLAAGVAHEINNPLSFVKANVVFVREALLAPARRDGEASEVIGALGDAEFGIERIRRIVADLRGLARQDGDAPCGTDAAAALHEAVRLASFRTKGLRVTVTAPEGDLPIAMCRKRVVQVLLNLVVNAADAVEHAAGDGRRWIEVSAEAAPEHVAFRVEDGGAGLPEEVRAHLFEPFFTTKPAGTGTGLGLALAHEHVTAVGGRIFAGNGARGGALFEVHVPVHRGEPGCSTCEREPAEEARRGAVAC